MLPHGHQQLQSFFFLGSPNVCNTLLVFGFFLPQTYLIALAV